MGGGGHAQSLCQEDCLLLQVPRHQGMYSVLVPGPPLLQPLLLLQPLPLLHLFRTGIATNICLSCGLLLQTIVPGFLPCSLLLLDSLLLLFLPFSCLLPPPIVSVCQNYFFMLL